MLDAGLLLKEGFVDFGCFRIGSSIPRILSVLFHKRDCHSERNLPRKARQMESKDPQQLGSNRVLRGILTGKCPLRMPLNGIAAYRCMGSFDSAGPSLREGLATLRMTGFWLVWGLVGVVVLMGPCVTFEVAYAR